MLFVVEEKLKGLKFNIDFGGRGEVQRRPGGIEMSTMQTGAILGKCLNTFVSHCSYPHRHYLYSCQNIHNIAVNITAMLL